jgi:hypothetical protein
MCCDIFDWQNRHDIANLMLKLKANHDNFKQMQLAYDKV